MEQIGKKRDDLRCQQTACLAGCAGAPRGSADESDHFFESTPFTAVTRVQIPSGTPNLTPEVFSSQKSHKSCMIDVFLEFKKPQDCDHTKPLGKSISQ